MPAPGFDASWFVSPYGFGAWYHPDGWCLYPNGQTHSPPPDFHLEPGGAFWLGYGDKVTYNRFNWRLGGSTYYVPQYGAAINSKWGFLSIVGRSMIGSGAIDATFAGKDAGYDCVWTNLGPKPGGVQNRWRVDLVIRPDGLLTIPYPSWAGKSYPEYPPLSRGRQRKVP
jgi:hypothetical protein